MINSLNDLQSIITKDSTIFWFRRDLRIHDNAGLYYALKENKNIIPLFIFDTVILNTLEDTADKRVDFIYQSLLHLQEQLISIGTSLFTLYGDPTKIFKEINVKAVYTNDDYERYAIDRDKEVSNILAAKEIGFKNFKDHVIFEKDEIKKDNGAPYTVFTPYSRKWKATLNNFYVKSYPTEKYYSSFKPLKPLGILSLNDIGFKASEAQFPDRKVKASVIQQYHQHRDFPALLGTSRLGVHLRFGTISIRKIAQIARNKNETWLNELIWRDFYSMILFHFPYVEKKSFKAAYDYIAWRNNEREFLQWCKGLTGYPLVDAGMRELNETGFMHNRVRMVAASFLTKHLLIDWRWGEAYFAKKLLDFDLASNNGGWQWAAGCGCDAAPYFRIFNPALQAQKFDRDNQYIKKWIPEIDSSAYPSPIVDHAFARHRAIQVYKRALG